MFFLFNKGAGNTESGVPYCAKWKDENGNSRYRDILRPEVCSKYFTHCNKIDSHNQSRQFDLKLEKMWVINDGFFRIITIIFGMTIVNVWNASKYHTNCGHPHKKLSVLGFASILAKGMLNNSFSKFVASDEALTIGVDDDIDDDIESFGSSVPRTPSPRKSPKKKILQ